MLEKLAGTNTLAYYIHNGQKCFLTLCPIVNLINLVNFLTKARMFVPGKPRRSILMFSDEAKAYLSETTFRCSTLRWAPSLTLKRCKGWKGLPGANAVAYSEDL
jgi:hypothetical protein